MSMNLTVTAELNDLSIDISVPQTPTEITHKILEQPNIKASFEISVDEINKMNPNWLLKNVRIKKKIDDVDNTKLVKVLEKIYHKLSITNSIELTTDEVDEYVESELRERGFKLSYHYFYGNRSVKVSW